MRSNPSGPRRRSRHGKVVGLALLAAVAATAPSAGQALDVWLEDRLQPAVVVEEFLYLAPNASGPAKLYLDSVGLTELEYFQTCFDMVSFRRPVASGTPVLSPIGDVIHTFGTQVSNPFFWSPLVSLVPFDEWLQLTPTPFFRLSFVAGTPPGQAQSILYSLDIGRVVETHPSGELLVQSFSRSGLEVIEQVKLLAARGDVEHVSHVWRDFYCSGPSGGPPGGGIPPWSVAPQVPTAQPIGLLALVLGLAALGAARLRSRRA